MTASGPSATNEPANTSGLRVEVAVRRKAEYLFRRRTVNVRLNMHGHASAAVQTSARERHSSGATTAPRIPTLSIAALTRPSDFASSMNRCAYASPASLPFGITIACGSTPARPSRT